MKAVVDVDFEWKNVVIGADLDAVKFAYDNRYFLIKNRPPHHYSYDGKGTEREWAIKIYWLYGEGLVPFVDKSKKIRVFSKDKLIKVFTDHDVFSIKYEHLYPYDVENVSGVSLNRELDYYRVVDWFDCRGLYDLGFDEIRTEDDFVRKIKFFKTLRIDGDQRYLDLFCESLLTKEQLSCFEYSDTMTKFKILDLLKKRGIEDAKMTLWKRDIYPVYKTN